MSTLSAANCYYPNAAKLLPLGFAALSEPDLFGRRQYESDKALIAVDCAEGASGEVTIWREMKSKSSDRVFAGRAFTGLLLSEQFFDQLLETLQITTS